MSVKIIIASLPVGGGHGRAAKCVGAELRQLDPNCTVEYIDLGEYCGPMFQFFYVRGYLLMVRRLPWLWGWIYRHPIQPKGTLPPWLLRLLLKRLEKQVDSWRPDVIVSTQLTASEAVASLRRRGRYTGAAVTIVTDFDAHPAWRAPEIDHFFVPDEAVRQQFIGLNVPAERLTATGVPVDPIFETPFDAQSLRRRHGFRDDVPLVLLMGGSLGFGAVDEVARAILALNMPLDLAIVAGHNLPLRQRLEALPRPDFINVQVFGFVDFIHELMAAADLFISKPGGLSMTEALSVGVPVLAINPIPGHEEANLRHLAGQGVVQTRRPGEKLGDAVRRLLGDEGERRRLRSAGRSYARPRSAHQIALKILELAEK